MASRLARKEQARAARLEHERAAAATALRRRRLALFSGIIAGVAVALVAVITLSGAGASKPSGTPNSSINRAAVQRVEAMLAGLPQGSGNVLGNESAPVTVTEFADLQCSACAAFDLPVGVSNPAGITGTGIIETLIREDVATGRVKLVYKSLETATSNGATPGVWSTQQAAVNAAGLQRKAWNYAELFYNEQGTEGTDYVTMPYLEGLAKQIPGLDYKRWLRDLTAEPSIRQQVIRDNTQGTQLDSGRAATPTIWIKGPKGQGSYQGLTEPTAAQQIAVIQRAIAAAA